MNQTCLQLRLSLKEEDVDLLEELFMLEGIIFFDPSSVTDLASACQDAANGEISLLMQAVEELKETGRGSNEHMNHTCCSRARF
jgi:kinesin family member 5